MSAVQHAAPHLAEAPALPANGAGVAESLVALTHDETLIQTLSSVAPEHALHVVAEETALSARVAGEPTGVALLDASAVHTPLPELTRRLRAQFPDLVLVVAGGPQDQALIASQVTQGTVYRFLHKPVSEQRVKLFVDAAWRRHDVEHAATGSFAALKLDSGTSEPTLPRAALWGIGAAVACACGLALWLLLRSTTPVPGARSTQLPAPAPTPAARTQRSAQSLTDSLLTRADAALAQGTLSAPPAENAADLYSQALQRDPGNVRARAGLAKVLDQLLDAAEQALLSEQLDSAARLTAAARALQPDNVRVAFLLAQLAKERERSHASAASAASASVAATRSAAASSAAAHGAQQLAQARAALQSGQLTEAERLLLAAGDAGAAPEELATLQRQLQSLRIAAKASAMARDSELFHQRLAQGQLVEPAADSAKFYYEQLLAAEPAHPSTVLARDALAARLLEEARKAAGHNDLDAAQGWLTQARAVDASAADASGLEQTLAAARNAQNIISATQLQRVHYVAPVYPTLAESLGRAGVVELEFTVRTDGSVGDIRVTNAEPARMFDAAALDAVRQWRYKPVQRDGHPVDQRVRLRVTFSLAP